MPPRERRDSTTKMVRMSESTRIGLAIRREYGGSTPTINELDNNGFITKLQKDYFKGRPKQRSKIRKAINLYLDLQKKNRNILTGRNKSQLLFRPQTADKEDENMKRKKSSTSMATSSTSSSKSPLSNIDNDNDNDGGKEMKTESTPHMNTTTEPSPVMYRLKWDAVDDEWEIPECLDYSGDKLIINPTFPGKLSKFTLWPVTGQLLEDTKSRPPMANEIFLEACHVPHSSSLSSSSSSSSPTQTKYYYRISMDPSMIPNEAFSFDATQTGNSYLLPYASSPRAHHILLLPIHSTSFDPISGFLCDEMNACAFHCIVNNNEINTHCIRVKFPKDEHPCVVMMTIKDLYPREIIYVDYNKIYDDSPTYEYHKIISQLVADCNRQGIVQLFLEYDLRHKQMECLNNLRLEEEDIDNIDDTKEEECGDMIDDQSRVNTVINDEFLRFPNVHLMLPDVKERKTKVPVRKKGQYSEEKIVFDHCWDKYFVLKDANPKQGNGIFAARPMLPGMFLCVVGDEVGPNDPLSPNFIFHTVHAFDVVTARIVGNEHHITPNAANAIPSYGAAIASQFNEPAPGETANAIFLKFHIPVEELTLKENGYDMQFLIVMIVRPVVPGEEILIYYSEIPVGSDVIICNDQPSGYEGSSEINHELNKLQSSSHQPSEEFNIDFSNSSPTGKRRYRIGKKFTDSEEWKDGKFRNQTYERICAGRKLAIGLANAGFPLVESNGCCANNANYMALHEILNDPEFAQNYCYRYHAKNNTSTSEMISPHVLFATVTNSLSSSSSSSLPLTLSTPFPEISPINCVLNIRGIVIPPIFEQLKTMEHRGTPLQPGLYIVRNIQAATQSEDEEYVEKGLIESKNCIPTPHPLTLDQCRLAAIENSSMLLGVIEIGAEVKELKDKSKPSLERAWWITYDTRTKHYPILQAVRFSTPIQLANKSGAQSHFYLNLQHDINILRTSPMDPQGNAMRQLNEELIKIRSKLKS